MTTATAAPAKERPVNFTGDEVRAILAGVKTKMRRVMEAQEVFGHETAPLSLIDGMVHAYADGRWQQCVQGGGKGRPVRCLYEPGDVLWVHEKWSDVYRTYDGQCHTRKPDAACQHFTEYAATVADGQHPPRWRSPIHMPRHLSRITLEIVAVKLEPVQNISEADAIAEGLPTRPVIDPMFKSGTVEYWSPLGWCHSARTAFEQLWNDLHGHGAWDRNDMVEAYTFRRVDTG